MFVLDSRRYRRRRHLVLGGVVAFAVFIVLAPADSALTTAVDDLAQFAAAVFAAVAAAFAARRAPRRSNRARSWWLVAAASASWGAGQAVWTIYEVGLGREVPFPSPADAGFLLFVPLAFWSFLPHVETPATHLSRARACLDSIIIAGGLFFISWVLVLRTIVEEATGSRLEQFLAIAYPVGDILVMSVALYAATRRRAGHDGSLGVLALGIAAIGFSDSAFLYLTQTGAYGGAQLPDIGWVAGFMLLALAATKPAPVRERHVSRARSVGTHVFPFVPIGASAMIAGVEIAQGRRLDAVALYDAIFVIIVLVLHQIWVTVENHAITDTLAQRVEERTAALTKTERYFRQMVEKSSDVVMVLTPHLVVRDVAASLEEIFGIAPSWVRGRPVAHLFPDESSAPLHAGIARAMLEPESAVTAEWTLTDASGRVRHAQTVITNLVDDPAVGGLVLNTRDITAQKELEDALRHQAFHDPLTKMPNRALFVERAEHALVRGRRNGTTTAVLLIDLDDFKTINDSLGHNAGDELLVNIAQRLRRDLRAVDTIARLGGDEFVVLLEDLERPGEADETAARLLAAIRGGMQLAGREVQCGASIGVAVSDAATTTVEALLRNADTAMYVSKREGRGRATTFRGDMHERARERLELQLELSRAIDDGELVLQYQPSIDLDLHHLDGFEALVRWNHPTRGMLGPGAFIPLAEETGLVVPLGRWVLAEACRTAAGWLATATVGADFALAVNVSARQLEYGGLVDDVRHAVTTAGLAPQRLVLEITESVLVDDSRTVIEQLQQLKALGVRIAIDDFGTGYASLAYLRQLPIDILKVDKTFVDDAASGDEGSRFLRAILNLGRTLQLRTVAEGIEEPEQLTTLRASGCDIGQGFYFSRPLDEEAAAAFLQSAAAARAV